MNTIFYQTTTNYNIIIALKDDDLLVNIIADSGLLNSKSEARRMIKQSAVKIDGETVTDIHHKENNRSKFLR